MIRILIEDESYQLDPDRLMLSESMALEDQWGLRPGRFASEISSGDPSTRAVGAMVWLVKVRALAAKEGLLFSAAADLLPVAGFDFNIGSVRQDDTPEPANPTHGATPAPTTRTTRRTSAARRAKTASAPSGAPGSAPSPSG